MAQPKSSNKPVPDRQPDHQDRRFQRLLAQGGREGALIGLVALTVYLLMALLSFNPADPGWASVGHTTQATNASGAIGAWFASLLFNLFGQVAFLFPALTGFAAVRVFRVRESSEPLHWPLFLLRFGGILLLLLSTTSLLALYSVWGLDAQAGGIIGKEVAGAMIKSFNLPATTLILVAIFLFALTIVTSISWFALMDTIGRGLMWAWRRLRGLPDAAALSDPAEPDPVEQAARLLHGLSPAAVEPTPSGWRRWFTRRKPAASPERREPVIGTISDENNSQKIKSRSIEVPATASATDRLKGRLVGRPAVDEEASIPLLTITPFKRDKAASKRVQQEVQNSLFDDERSPIPPIALLDKAEPNLKPGYSREQLENLSRLLEEKLLDFGVSVKVVEVHPGPVITRFEIKPAAGVKVSRISNLAKDLARSLAVISVRVVEVIPGKSVVGIEIPNEVRQIVRLSEVLSAPVFEESQSPLTMALGNDIGGNPMVANLSKMPHLLVAGTTGSGKSVGVNAMILSILLKATPEEVRFIMVDPKMLELSIYEGVPHLLTPVVTDMKEAANALRWCVAEMERRYRLMASLGVRNLAGYNRKLKDAELAGEPILDPFWKPENQLENDEGLRPALEAQPFIVVVIDEFADMMMVVGKKVEELIARIAQKARAAGIHLILATQRPSVDVITGLIKANIPTRMSFQVSSKIDSRTILDQGGAEQLLGHGDMLYLPPGSGLPVRVHGAFVADDEVHRVVNAWKARGQPNYLDEILNGGESDSMPGTGAFTDDSNEGDALFDEAVAFVTESRRVSISSVQRKFKIGYNRAANLVEAMEVAGVVSAAGHNGTREVLAGPAPRD